MNKTRSFNRSLVENANAAYGNPAAVAFAVS